MDIVTVHALLYLWVALTPAKRSTSLQGSPDIKFTVMYYSVTLFHVCICFCWINTIEFKFKLSEILIGILTLSFKKMRLNVSFEKWRPFVSVTMEMQLSLQLLNAVLWGKWPDTVRYFRRWHREAHKSADGRFFGASTFPDSQHKGTLHEILNSLVGHLVYNKVLWQW